MVLIKIIKGKNARLIMKTTRTTDLLNELSTDDSNIHFKSYITSHADDMSCDNLQDYFNLYFKDHPELLTADVIKRSNLDRGYAYQILNFHVIFHLLIVYITNQERKFRILRRFKQLLCITDRLFQITVWAVLIIV